MREDSFVFHYELSKNSQLYSKKANSAGIIISDVENKNV